MGQFLLVVETAHRRHRRVYSIQGETLTYRGICNPSPTTNPEKFSPPRSSFSSPIFLYICHFYINHSCRRALTPVNAVLPTPFRPFYSPSGVSLCNVYIETSRIVHGKTQIYIQRYTRLYREDKPRVYTRINRSIPQRFNISSKRRSYLISLLYFYIIFHYSRCTCVIFNHHHRRKTCKNCPIRFYQKIFLGEQKSIWRISK